VRNLSIIPVFFTDSNTAVVAPDLLVHSSQCLPQG
jgi:hypothetical protein